MENWSVAREVHVTLVTAEAMEAMAMGHAVSCTSTTLSSDSMVASIEFVTFALRDGESLTATLLADGDAEIVEFRRPVRTPFVGKENASREKVNEIAHRASQGDISKQLPTLTKHKIF